MARRARYRLLVAHAREIGATYLATAHTLDDQAETLLMRLAAGSGLSGLAGMRREVERQGIRHVRPFLHVRKARLVVTCRLRGWSYVEDSSNIDPRFARVRWRNSIMPMLAAEGLDAERLGRLAARLARANDALDQVSEAVFARVASRQAGIVILDLALLAAEPLELALRVLRRALAAATPAPVRRCRASSARAARGVPGGASCGSGPAGPRAAYACRVPAEARS
ncbi:tRNA lysidine(34) synthetase TilS [Micromonospora sp. STR1s_5]|nr:tRNA lysidine(34) synthetase TilS [Micromonospora sp. STR1s_5]